MSETKIQQEKILPLTLVAAIASNGAIGKANAIPWRAPSDLKRFREITWGRPLVMGRKTYESIGKPLPGRETFVVTSDKDFGAAEGLLDHLHVVAGFEEALTKANRLGLAMHAPEIILAGGAEIYRQGLERAQWLRLTFVDCAPEADAFFPPIDWSQWREMRRESPERGPKDEQNLQFVDFRRC
jgi:dihydrofolate reductase